MNPLVPTSDPDDAASLAVSVRELASSAHALLRDPAASVEDLLAALRRISRLEARLRGASDNPLGHWMENLRRRVEAAVRDRDEDRGWCPSVPFRRGSLCRPRRVTVGGNV
jgi:hypothetical protein